MTVPKPKERWVPRPPYKNGFHLTDEVWLHLKNMESFEDEARLHLQGAMDKYLYNKKAFSQKPRPNQTRAQIETMLNAIRRIMLPLEKNSLPAAPDSQLAKATLEDLGKVLDLLRSPGNDLWGALASAAPMLHGLALRGALDYLNIQVRELEYVRIWLQEPHSLKVETMSNQKGLISLNEIADWLQKAIDSVECLPSGPDRTDEDILVEHLDAILRQFSKKHPKGLSFSRNNESPVDFVNAVLRAMGAEVSSGTRDRAIKAFIARKQS